MTSQNSYYGLSQNYTKIIKYCNYLSIYRCTFFRVHIRRTDKIGSFHKLEEYMYYVEQFYKLQKMNERNVFKSIYLATDDPTLFEEASKKRVRVVLFFIT